MLGHPGRGFTAPQAFQAVVAAHVSMCGMFMNRFELVLAHLQQASDMRQTQYLELELTKYIDSIHAVGSETLIASVLLLWLAIEEKVCGEDCEADTCVQTLFAFGD